MNYLAIVVGKVGLVGCLKIDSIKKSASSQIMQNQYPKYFRSETGDEQIKLFNANEQAYVRAIKLRNGFDYCAYRNWLLEGEEEHIQQHYLLSSESEYLTLLNKVVNFFVEVRQHLPAIIPKG